VGTHKKKKMGKSAGRSR